MISLKLKSPLPISAEEEGIVTIERKESNYKKKQYSCTDYSFLLNNSLTIHKLQGIHMQKVIVKLGTHEFANSLENSWSSRVHNMENVVFDPISKWSQFIDIFLTKSYKLMLAKKEKNPIQESKRMAGKLAEAGTNIAVCIYQFIEELFSV